MIYILLPAYNEGESIDLLLKRTKTSMENHGFNYQVIVYNDGSTDNTLDILKLNRHRVPLKIIGKDQNEGLGFALFSLISLK